MDLKTNEQSDVQFIVDLLIVDCEYEMALFNKYDLNYYEFLEKYQNILDRYELSDFYKEIVSNRIRFVRYKM